MHACKHVCTFSQAQHAPRFYLAPEEGAARACVHPGAPEEGVARHACACMHASATHAAARCSSMHMGAHAPGMRGAGPDPEGVHAGLPTLRPYGRLVHHCGMHGCFNIGMHMNTCMYICHVHACICLDMNMLTLRMACMQLPSPPGSSRRSFV